MDPLPGLIVAIFDDEASAEEARREIDASGFPSDVVKLSHADPSTLATATGTNAADWQETLGASGRSVVLVAGGQQSARIRTLLREAGAAEILGPAEDKPVSSTGANRQAELHPVDIGMTVMSADRREVGRIKRVHGGAMLVDRPFRPDLWIPLRSIQTVIDSWVVLSVPFDKVDLAASFLLDR